MGIRQRFDANKAIEVLLYIAQKSPKIYNALKVFYFADKDHLSKYGRLICGDSYVAMRHGPVPSGAYDLVKYARGDRFCWGDLPIDEAFAVQGHNIVPRREPDLDFLSETDKECLELAIDKYGHLSFRQLKRLSHDEAYEAADENDFIQIEAIANTLPNRELLLDYLETR